MIDSKILLLVPVLSLIGSGTYIYALLKGRVVPNRVTWLLWALAPLIAFAAELNAGVGLQSLVTFTSGFGPLLVFIASYFGPKAAWNLTKFDYVCGGLSLLGLGLWIVTREGNYAIIFAILADGLAGLPTIRKAYLHPESESSLVFSLAIISCVLTLLTIDQWTIAHAAFPIYLLAICLVLVALIKFKVGLRLKGLRAT